MTKSSLSLFAAALVCSACAPHQAAKPAAAAAQPAPAAVAQAPSPASAAAPVQAAAAAPAAKGPERKLWGVVQSFDSGSSTLVIKDKRGHTITLTLASDVKLTKGGDDAAADAAELKAGTHLRLRAAGTVVRSAHILVQTAKAAQVAKGS